MGIYTNNTIKVFYVKFAEHYFKYYMCLYEKLIDINFFLREGEG